MKNKRDKFYKNEWLDFNQFRTEFEKVPVEEFPNNVFNSIPFPRISIRITTYQQVNYISNAIDSVLMQRTDFPFEILIGDDESTDGTREICIEYAKRYPDLIRLFLHKRDNNISVLGKPCGIFQITYNLFQSRGEYISGCSGDDYWTDPTKLQKQYEFLSKNQMFSYCYHDWRLQFEDADENKPGFGAINKTDRIQTLLYKNVFNKIPREFLNVIQEDTFIKYIIGVEGPKKYIPDISPNICRIHSNNIWGVSEGANRNYEKFEFHSKSRVHTWEKIKEAYKNTKYEKEIQKIVSNDIVVINTLTNPKLSIINKLPVLLLKSAFYSMVFRYFRKQLAKIFRYYKFKLRS